MDDNVTLDRIMISDRYDSPLRKDRTNHGGDILIYLASNIMQEEMIWNTSGMRAFGLKLKQNMSIL